MPYIVPADDTRKATREALASLRQQLKVGIAWAGSKAHSNDRNRSCALATLAPLFDLPDMAWFSLQHGDAARQIDSIAATSRLVPLAADATLEATAALIAELDLVISVDTSIAHLAGALARPCWVLLPFAPDWRWMLRRADSPWYPSARLFRQPEGGDWESAVASVLGRSILYASAVENNDGLGSLLPGPDRSLKGEDVPVISLDRLVDELPEIVTIQRNVRTSLTSGAATSRVR